MIKDITPGDVYDVNKEKTTDPISKAFSAFPNPPSICHHDNLLSLRKTRGFLYHYLFSHKLFTTIHFHISSLLSLFFDATTHL